MRRPFGLRVDPIQTELRRTHFPFASGRDPTVGKACRTECGEDRAVHESIDGRAREDRTGVEDRATGRRPISGKNESVAALNAQAESPRPDGSALPKNCRLTRRDALLRVRQMGRAAARPSDYRK